MNSKVVISLFFFFYLILPEYFALEISASLPLLTASRILIVLLFLLVIYFDFGKIRLKTQSKALGFYFFIIILVNCLHLKDCFSDSVKCIASVIMEQWLLILLVVQILDSREKIERAVDAMVWASGLIGILAMFETVTGVNVFYFLTTTKRDMLQSAFFRMGMLRAEGPFGHSVYLGTYCVCMIPFALYFYETKRKKRYLLIAMANMIGTFASGSRGQILILALVLIYIFGKKKPSIKMKYIRLMLVMVPVATVALLVVPTLREMFFNTMKSVLAALGFSFSLTDYGANSTGWNSRIWQLSGFLHLYKENSLFFGLGYGCQVRGLVYYFWDGVWRQINTFDVGYVGIAMQYGLFGLIAYMGLFGSNLRKGLRLGSKQDIYNMNNTFVFFYVAYMLNLLSTVGVESMLFLVLGIHFAYIRVSARQTNAPSAACEYSK